MSQKRGWAVALLAGAAAMGLAGSVRATVYTDATGEAANGAASEDISSVTVTNTSTTVQFVIQLNSAAALSSTANDYGYYEIGIQTPAGGSTAVSNPYTNPIGISTGMTDFIAAQLNPNQGYVYEYEPSSSSFSIGLLSTVTPVAVTNTDTSVTVTVPLSFLGTADSSGNPSGIAAGSSFKFDVWSTYSGSSNGAYDALDNATATPGYGSSYDAATASGTTFATTSYTVTGASTPEPAVLGLAGLCGVTLTRRRRG